jgi:hypothetical protein
MIEARNQLNNNVAIFVKDDATFFIEFDFSAKIVTEHHLPPF